VHLPPSKPLMIEGADLAGLRFFFLLENYSVPSVRFCGLHYKYRFIYD
jgi:hypothetical protein